MLKLSAEHCKQCLETQEEYHHHVLSRWNFQKTHVGLPSTNNMWPHQVKEDCEIIFKADARTCWAWMRKMFHHMRHKHTFTWHKDSIDSLWKEPVTLAASVKTAQNYGSETKAGEPWLAWYEVFGNSKQTTLQRLLQNLIQAQWHLCIENKCWKYTWAMKTTSPEMASVWRSCQSELS